MVEGSQLYQIVVTPVYVEAQQGEALLNVLVAGYPVTPSLAATLKQSTGSDFIYLAEGNTVVSTLDPNTTRVLAASAPTGSGTPLEEGWGRRVCDGNDAVDLGGRPHIG